MLAKTEATIITTVSAVSVADKDESLAVFKLVLVAVCRRALSEPDIVLNVRCNIYVNERG
jgi:hypothetical protein